MPRNRQIQIVRQTQFESHSAAFPVRFAQGMTALYGSHAPGGSSQTSQAPPQPTQPVTNPRKADEP